jgi:hypothetical protein
VSDINTAVVDSLKVLDPKRPIREADITTSSRGVCFASAFGRYKLLIAGVQIVMAGRVLMAVILIVEDDSFIRETAEMMIQDLGHHTLSASDVDEALLLLRAPQHIDALFTDIYPKTFAPWRQRSCATGYRASARIACALHDRQCHRRQSESYN